MITEIKKKLSITFLSIMAGLGVLTLIVIFSFLNYRLGTVAEEHIMVNVAAEFMPHYEKNDIVTLSKIVEDEHFQVMNKKGEVVIDVQSTVHFDPLLNTSHLEAAFSGNPIFEQDDGYMVAYLPLDRDYVLRVTMSMEGLSEFQRSFTIIILLVLPVVLLLSYALSRYMVTQSLEPIKKVLTYHETFSSTVTHELNSPLTSMKGNLEVLLRRDRSEQEYKETSKLVLRKINEIINLLNNLHLLATSKLKPLDLYKETVNLEKIVEEIAEKYKPSLHSQDIKLSMSLQPDVYCECDASLVKRAIENLVQNAFKFTPPAGLIEIQARHEERECILAISNTCEHLEQKDLENLFKPFYRGPGSLSRDTSGKGLGLYIVQYIITSHGGTITAGINNNQVYFTMRIPGYNRA